MHVDIPSGQKSGGAQSQKRDHIGRISQWAITEGHTIQIVFRYTFWLVFVTMLVFITSEYKQQVKFART